MVNTINGIYSAQSSSEDKDIAMLCYQFGGPGLLDILHRLLHLPSTSTSKMACQGRIIDSSINTPINKLAGNFEFDESCPKYGYMLKIDETYTDS